jgi:hydrogenase maturation protease
MERMVGYDRAILVDAIHGSGDPPGTVRVWPVESIPGREASHLDSAHDVPIVVALATGSALGATLPRRIEVVSVEATAVATFSEVLTPEVEAAIPVAAGAVLRLLADDRDGHCRLPTGAADLAATGQGA